jgi:hypothetical protein
MVKHGEVDFALSSIPARPADPDLRLIRLHEDRAGNNPAAQALIDVLRDVGGEFSS